jgi:hypothetical protein
VPGAAVVGAAFQRLSDGGASEVFETCLAVPRGETIVAQSAVRDGDAIYLVGCDITAERSTASSFARATRSRPWGRCGGLGE